MLKSLSTSMSFVVALNITFLFSYDASKLKYFKRLYNVKHSIITHI